MGTNSRQRRAAKKRLRGRGPTPPRASASTQGEAPLPTAADLRAMLDDVATRVRSEPLRARHEAEQLLAPARPLTPHAVRAGMHSYLADLLHLLTTSGWSPSDLAEITRRRAGQEHVPLITGLLQDEAARHAPDRVHVRWREDLQRTGVARPLALYDAHGMQEALALLAALTRLPALPSLLPAPGTREQPGPASPGDVKLLTRVQALLAKAEATDFDDEADALTAKAQELISRHSLDRLLARATAGGAQEQPAVRRLWLDAPYLMPKGLLVHVVADANRCRSVISERLGCCTIVGAANDLDAVDVLVPSLLLQAHVAMTRSGARRDASGTSRTRSFRQAFLLSYADRIGERLAAADERATTTNEGGGALVPLLARHREQVDAACDAMFPNAVARGATASNAQGWWAGRAAADHAELGADAQGIATAHDRAAS